MLSNFSALCSFYQSNCQWPHLVGIGNHPRNGVTHSLQDVLDNCCHQEGRVSHGFAICSGAPCNRYWESWRWAHHDLLLYDSILISAWTSYFRGEGNTDFHSSKPHTSCVCIVLRATKKKQKSPSVISFFFIFTVTSFRKHDHAWSCMMSDSQLCVCVSSGFSSMDSVGHTTALSGYQSAIVNLFTFSLFRDGAKWAKGCWSWIGAWSPQHPASSSRMVRVTDRDSALPPQAVLRMELKASGG